MVHILPHNKQIMSMYNVIALHNIICHYVAQNFISLNHKKVNKGRIMYTENKNMLSQHEYSFFAFFFSIFGSFQICNF